MLILVKLIGILFVGLGVIFLLNPKSMKQYVAFVLKGKRIYLCGMLRILIGVIFLLAASQCRLSGVIIILGILTLIKGLMVFVLGPEKIKSILNWWAKKSDSVIRLLSIIAIAIGALIIYSV